MTMTSSPKQQITEAIKNGRLPDLSSNDMLATLIAMHVRNAMEDFHAANTDVEVEGLDDAAMAKLNPVIRRAIWEVLQGVSGDPRYRDLIGFSLMSVPTYWEAPSALPGIEGSIVDDSITAATVTVHGDVPWGELHVGHVSIFTAAGFTEVSRPSLRRAVMRIDF
jgi:hypothetical protein